MSNPSKPMITIPAEDYIRLVWGLEMDNDVVWCEVCRAWMDIEDEAYANAEDFEGCWKAATCSEKYDHLCVSHRSASLEEAKMLIAKIQEPVDA